MSLLIAMPGRDHQSLLENLKQLDTALDIRIWPDIGKAEEIDFAILWNQPPDLLAKLSGLRVAHSYGAGVEHILADPALMQTTDVGRVCGSNLNTSMCDYLTGQIEKHRLSPVSDTTIGLLGFGELGRAVARKLTTAGLQVLAYSRNPKDDVCAESYHGDGLCEMIPHCDFLICLLPLTAVTQNMLNVRLFSLCKPGAWLINVGRGNHLVDNDLIHALDEGHVRGATLDVTRQEPLPSEHPFRQRSDIELTEHTASITDPAEAARLIYRNYQHMQHDEPLEFAVDRQQGY